jgi:hypothetical protein
MLPILYWVGQRLMKRQAPLRPFCIESPSVRGTFIDWTSGRNALPFSSPIATKSPHVATAIDRGLNEHMKVPAPRGLND